MQRLCFLLLTFLSWFAGHVWAYVPATATNSTNDAIAGGLNVSDVSQLHLQWYSNGWFWDSSPVSYQLVGLDSQGLSQGVLVHFSETQTNNDTPATTTPWIALVSCDYNATNASLEIDIFTLARDKGAVAALLYSLYSSACIINPEYADPNTFDQVFDIFSTQSNYASHQIEYSFRQVNESYSWYDSQRLNGTAQSVNDTFENNATPDSGYLFATLRAYNASGDANITDTSGTSSGSGGDSNGGSNTALAMIVLYAITGCVSALFCVVIISGAVRAFRHPERYGPRYGFDGTAQSRARGLGRAILDTFPIVKFGSSSGNSPPPPRPQPQNKDLESRASNETADSPTLEMRAHGPTAIPLSQAADGASLSGVAITQRQDSSEILIAESSQPIQRQPRVRTSQDASSPNANGDDVMPEAIGRETCPICIVDFEEGDDLRQLPCEGHHRFHQQCVDPWLLELSSSCPICRQDFLALENMLSSDPQNSNPNPASHRESRGNRFSRYVRFAIRRRHRHDEPDPTNPPLPIVAHTSL